jgi:heat shock protein HslJ
MRMRTQVLLPALLAVAIAACGGSSKPPAAGAPPSPSVAGHTYLSTGVTGHTLVPGSQISLSFTPDGHIGANAGCNSMSGPYRIEGDQLVVSDLAQTEMGCDPPARMDQDTWLGAFLTSRPTLVLNGDTLRISDSTAAITLVDRKVAEPDRPLQATKWIADTVIDRDAVSSDSPAGDSEVSIVLGPSKVTGRNGCNSYDAGVVVSGDTLTFSDFHSTTVPCPHSAMADRLGALVGGTGPVKYAIDADRLTLTAADGTGLGLHAAR